jgi:hypothetical protein
LESSTRIPIRVFILAEAHLYSRALARFLSGQEALTVIGMDDDTGRALAQLDVVKPDVVLLDTEIANSAVAVSRIADVDPTIRVVALAVPSGESDLIACAKARVAGYVSREEDPQDLVVTLPGTTGADVISGTTGNDVIDAGDGNDVVVGAGGNDIVCGGPGNDVIVGAEGNDQLGGAGDDIVVALGGTDVVGGDDGNNQLFGRRWCRSGNRGRRGMTYSTALRATTR